MKTAFYGLALAFFSFAATSVLAKDKQPPARVVVTGRLETWKGMMGAATQSPEGYYVVIDNKRDHILLHLPPAASQAPLRVVSAYAFSRRPAGQAHAEVLRLYGPRRRNLFESWDSLTQRNDSKERGQGSGTITGYTVANGRIQGKYRFKAFTGKKWISLWGRLDVDLPPQK